MDREYRLECEECDSITVVLVDNDCSPSYCPCCDSDVIVEDITEEE